MASVSLAGAELGNVFQTLLMTPDLIPGDQPSYAACKAILIYHPLGGKMCETPIKMAQSQQRTIEIPGAPERVKTAYLKEWLKLNATRVIRNTMKTSRAYGIASVAMLEPGGDMAKPPDFDALYKKRIVFNVFDPLNTAGSLVLNQNPNDVDFQKHSDIRVNGILYHRGRTQVVMCGDPIYIEYVPSAFGFVGRSVFQAAFFPLKSFINTMITDDLVVRKAGVFIEKLKQVSSAVDSVVSRLFGIKRQILKESQNSNVISIGHDEAIETLNMQNIDGAFGAARTNIVTNIATAADMPAVILKNESLSAGAGLGGEGTEDAKMVAGYIDDIREQMEGLYAWFDKIAQARAWNPDFYATIQAEYPDEFGSVEYKDAFYKWTEAFSAEWPSLLIEPDSERAKADKVRLDALIASADVMLGAAVDPENKARILEFLQDNINAMKLLFPIPLDLDFQAIIDFVPPEVMGDTGDGEIGESDPPTLRPLASASHKARELHAVNA